MTSSPVMASAGLTGAVSGVATGSMPDMTGLGGLFAALMGGSSPVGHGMSEIVLRQGSVGTAGESGAMVDAASFLAAQGEVEQVFQLEGEAGTVTVKGDAATVQAFLTQVKDIYEKVIREGGLDLSGAGDTAALAGALQELGMDAETAQSVAGRIETMLQMVKNFHNKDGKPEIELDAETAGTLAAMMLTVMAQTQQPTADGKSEEFSLQISTAEQTLTVSNRAMPQLPVDANGEMLLRIRDGESLREIKAKPLAMQVLQVEVTQNGEAAKVAMFLPEPAVAQAAAVAAQTVSAEAPLADAAVDTQEISLAARAPVTVQAVKRDEVVTLPEGETYYTLKADAKGTDTVQAVKPLSASRDADDKVADVLLKAPETTATTQAQWMQQQRAEALANPALPAQAATSGAGYAAEFEAIQKMLDQSQVGRQVVVQIQPLLEQGGGTVRLQLNPVELGQVTVELTVAEGKVYGAIAASEPRVVEQLARELHTLRQGLADAGLKVSEQGINLMLSNGNGSGQFGQQSQNSSAQGASGGRRGREAMAGGTEGESADGASLVSNMAAWVSPDRVLDVNV